MSLRPRSFAPLFVASLLAACGSSGTSDSLGGASVALSKDVNRYLNALCERIIVCSEAAPMFESRAGCVERMVTLYACDARLESASLDGLTACLDALPDVPCGRILAQPLEQDACLSAIASLDHALGHNLVGEACGDETRCVAGATCYQGPDCGECRPMAQAGDACDIDCNGELFCNAAGKCEPLRIDGEACSSARECFSRICEADKCTSPRQGDPCIEDIYCGDFLRCVDAKCAPLAKLGDACDQLDDDFPVCTHDAECVNGRCEALTRCGEGKVGSFCSTDAQCGPGLNCSRGEDRCVKLANEGEECSYDHRQCAEGLRCVFDAEADAGTCQSGEPYVAPPDQLCE